MAATCSELPRRPHREPAGSTVAFAPGRDDKRIQEDVEALAAAGLPRRDRRRARVGHDEIRVAVPR
jgi:hypothetical protein